MEYKLIERKNPQQPQAAEKIYATPVNNGRVSQKEVAADIVGLSSLARGDVANVIDILIDTVPKYLLMGKSVSLGELGTFRISFSSEGVTSPEEFNVGLISGVRVVLTRRRHCARQSKILNSRGHKPHTYAVHHYTVCSDALHTVYRLTAQYVVKSYIRMYQNLHTYVAGHYMPNCKDVTRNNPELAGALKEITK
jgi:predicted histone-like DNA-binding protein